MRGRELRAHLIERDGPACRWCDRLTQDPNIVGDAADDAATIDHLIVRADGGPKHDPKNVVVACRRCNEDRGRLPLDEWRAVLRHRRVRATRTAQRLGSQEQRAGHGLVQARTANSD